MTTWHKGPPLSIGWWPASFCQNSDCFRWWNGSQWSFPTYCKEIASTEAAYFPKVSTLYQDNIEWTERPASWPERSRT